MSESEARAYIARLTYEEKLTLQQMLNQLNKEEPIENHD